MHPDVERIQRLLHGELPAPEENAVRDHLAACDDCRARVAQAEQVEMEVHALLRTLDHASPRIDAGTITGRAGEQSWRPARWAAGIALGLAAAGAAYAAPGSPLPAWVRAAAQWVGGSPGADSVATTPQAPEVSVAGIAVVPRRVLIVQFAAAQAEAELRVSLTDGNEVVVRAPSGAATFTSDGDRLLIDNRVTSPAPVFEIQIPRAAPRVEIQVAGALVFLKEGARVTSRCHKLACRLLPPGG